LYLFVKFRGGGRDRYRSNLRISLFALLLTPALLSQDAALFHETTTLVTVPCAVTDEDGLAIHGLGVDDFRLYVDGVRRKIDNLWSEADLPLLLGVINDVSDSQRNYISEKDRAVAQLLERVVHGQDRAFVVAVNDNVVLKSEVSTGPYGLRYRILATPGGEPLGVPCGTLEGAHGRKRPICGGTALWNAIYASAHLKLSGPGGNKALLVLSDGNDTGSTHSFGAALDEVRKSGAVVYAVTYPDSLSPDASWDDLRRLADETGGIVFDLRGTDYSQVISRITADLRGHYVLGFRPDSTASETRRHSLRVEVVRSGATVRARREYSDP
jgi:VWFA-related protein